MWSNTNFDRVTQKLRVFSHRKCILKTFRSLNWYVVHKMCIENHLVMADNRYCYLWTFTSLDINERNRLYRNPYPKPKCGSKLLKQGKWYLVCHGRGGAYRINSTDLCKLKKCMNSHFSIATALPTVS